MDAPSNPGHGEVKAMFFARAAEAQGQMLSPTQLPYGTESWKCSKISTLEGEIFRMVHGSSGSNTVFDAGKMCCGVEEKEGCMGQKEPG